MAKQIGSMAFLAIVVMLGLATSAHAAPITYTAVLSGLNEDTPNPSPATGFARVTIDEIANTMLIEVSFADLTAPNTAAHIHCCTTIPLTGTAAVITVLPTFTGFPAGMSGSYARLFDLVPFEGSDTYNANRVAAVGVDALRAALLDGLADGTAYLNIHTSNYPAGEIRGFLVPESTAVPEPATLALLGLGAVAALRRRSTRR